MAVNNINPWNSTMRLTGLGGSGLDTDTIVKQLMDAERMPLNKLYQKKQLAEWRQEAYRDITNKLRDLKDTYFNVAKSTSNLMSATSFKKYTGISSNSSYVTVSGNAESIAGSHTVSVINLATAGKAVSSSGVTVAMEGNEVSDFDLSGKKIRIMLDGVTKEITLDNYNSTGSEIVDKVGTGLQDLIDNAFGEGKVVVGYNEGTKQLSFDTNIGSNRITLASGSDNDGLSALGFSTGATNRLDLTKSLESLSSSFANGLTFNVEGKLKFRINSKEFTFDKSASLSSMINTINADADAKVNLKYDETTDNFVMTARQFGAGNNIIIDEVQEGSFFGASGASGINIDTSTMIQGEDARATIDGQLVIRNSNTFTINGATYTLVKAHSDPLTESETVSLSLNTSEIYDNIRGFVDKYNEIIADINLKLTEKYDRNFQPLTEEQKEEMSEEEIKKWETTAKTGLLKGDPMLQDIVYSMRRALSDTVAGMSANLSAIGITTGNYSEKGKLVINEAKLKAAIQNDPDGVSDLFIKKSNISYIEANTYDLRSQRYTNQGLASRISDILDDNIRTTGGKGKLLEKAGIKGDTTEFTSLIYKQIGDYDEDIDALVDKLKNKEDRYYAKFTALEKYISQMSVQSSWISQQFNNTSW